MKMKIKRNKLKKSGVTLLETILYFALFSVLIALIMPVIFEFDVWQQVQEKTTRSTDDYLFVQSRIKSFLSGANDLVIPAFNTTSSELLILMEHGGEARLYLDKEKSVFGIRYGDNEIIPLLATTTVSELFFDRRKTGGIESFTFSLKIGGESFASTTYFINYE